MIISLSGLLINSFKQVDIVIYVSFVILMVKAPIEVERFSSMKAS